MIHFDRPLTLAEVQSARARDSSLYFTQQRHPGYQAGWFHVDVCRKLEEFYRAVQAGERPMLMLFAPPQHGKSELVSRSFPAWAHGKDRTLRIVGASYASDLADKNCKDVQKIMESGYYKSVFDSRIAELGSHKGIRTSSQHEILGSTGTFRAVGVGGGLSGFPMDIGIIDDPFKDHQEAYSETTREAVWNWYLTVFRTRLSPRGGMIIMNTRWHEDDLCARVLDAEPGKWAVHNYKGIATEDEPHRKAGEALTPERYSVEVLREFERVAPQFFAALYQGEPVAPGGNLFKAEMFDFVELPREFEWSFITADTAYDDKKSNDFTVFTAWGVNGGEAFVRDVFRKQIKAAELEAPASQFIKKYSGYGFRGAYIEPKGHGIYLNQMLPRKGVMIPSESDIKEFFKDRTMDKVARANNAVPHLAYRKIHIGNTVPDKEALLLELLGFPRAKHDDFVDTVIDGIKRIYGRAPSILDAFR